jgi:hypothetical protein
MGMTAQGEEPARETARFFAGQPDIFTVKRPKTLFYIPAPNSLLELASPEFFGALHRRLEDQLKRRLAKELLRFRFAHALLIWRYLQGTHTIDGVFLTATGFDLMSLQELYGMPGGTLEDIVSLASREHGLPL